MSSHQDSNAFSHLRELLLPILADASVGVFDRDVPIEATNDREMKELLVGVQSLIMVIRQQQAEVVAARQEAADARHRVTEILDDILKRTIR